MKRIIIHAFFALAGAFIISPATAQVIQKFNTCPEAQNITEVKPFLQDNCWSFPNMDVNSGGWNPAIEGDGAIVSSAGTQNSGIYSPVLDVPGSLAVGFFYKFNADVTNIAWLNIYLTDYNNNIVLQMAGLKLSGMKGNTLYYYNTTFANLPSGAYKLFIEYESFLDTEIAIDDLQINVPFLYPGGCNQAPVAVNDHIMGNADRTASGKLSTNDYDPNGNYFTTYVITNSPHGTVTLDEEGNFTFAPNPGFTGNTTSFTYQACDNGFGPACSNIATVTITFATGMLPVRLVDFTASVNDANNVTVRWTTTYEQGSSYFEVERSFDGVTFETAGTVKAAGTSFGKNDYSFTEKLSSRITSKKDVYYRLRMVDQNHHAEVSKVLVLRLFKTSTLAMVSVTPNPVVNDINVQVQLKQDSYVVMKVIGNNGVELARKSIRGNEGLNVFSLDGTSKLQHGIYMLEVIINSNERMSLKLVKN